jgi:uncharacterized protein YdeI (YjbR/CyaY-like superfamily)
MHKAESALDFISQHPEWQGLLTALRQIVLQTGLEETIKWGVPVYTLKGKNVLGLTAFKHHVALWFFQGALLQDRAGKLVNAQEGKTRAQRQWRFTGKADIDETLILNYLSESIDNHRKGLTIKATPKKPFSLPPELRDALTRNPGLKPAFEGLATYKQREYAEYISGAKRADTKIRRLDKSIPLILAGKGLGDSYR